MYKYLIFFLILLVSCQPDIDKSLLVGIQPYNDFPKDKTDTIAKVITEFYDLKTVILPVLPLPENAFI